MPDPKLERFLKDEVIRDLGVAFYVVNKIGRSSGDNTQCQYFPTSRQLWELEHIVPQKATQFWGFSKVNQGSFLKSGLNRLGNFMVISSSINGHVVNHRLDFKIEGDTANVKCGANCGLHYKADSVYVAESNLKLWKPLIAISEKLSLDLGGNTKSWAKLSAPSGPQMNLANSVFRASTNFVRERSKMLARKAVENKVWSL